MSVIFPASLAAAHVANVADAAHDEAVVRTLGLGWTGAWRGLDAVLSGAFAALPLGTRALRASLASVASVGVGAGLVHVVARSLLARGADADGAGARPHAVLVSVVSTIAALAVGLSPAWQLEGQATGGAAVGACLALLPAAILLARAQVQPAGIALVAFALGLAASYEPLVFASAALSVAAPSLASRALRTELRAALTGVPGVAGAASAAGPGAPSARRRVQLATVAPVAAFALGLAPMGLALARHAARASLLSTNLGAFAGSAGEHGESGAGLLLALVRDEVGGASCVLAVAGVVVAALDPRLRARAAAPAVLAAMGLASLLFGAPAGPTRYGAPVLAAIGAAYVLAGVAMFAVVRAVAQARVPFARASAAMILVLELTFPARAADDTETRRAEAAPGAASAWSDAAWSALPAGAVVLVRDPRVHLRLLAARAQGELRADLAPVALFDLGGRGALRELARDAKLQPIWRDAVLRGDEGEWSLSSLAASRPLVAPYDPRWDRALARHLVPAGLFARFEPEPRGSSDRRHALDAFSASREKLSRAIDADPELLAITGTLLRARAIALAATSERDVVAHALDDLRPFSPRDPVATELVRRAAQHPHGAIDVTGLVP